MTPCSGTAEPGATITASDNGTVIGTIVVSADGNGAFPLSNIWNSNYSFRTTATDTAGHTSGMSAPPFVLTINAPLSFLVVLF